MDTDFSMNDLQRTGFVRGTVSHNGRRVLLEAESRCGGRWRLRIIGGAGRVSEWSDSFDSAAEAIVTGLGALQGRIVEFCDGQVVERGSRL